MKYSKRNINPLPKYPGSGKDPFDKFLEFVSKPVRFGGELSELRANLHDLDVSLAAEKKKTDPNERYIKKLGFEQKKLQGVLNWKTRTNAFNSVVVDFMKENETEIRERYNNRKEIVTNLYEE